MRHKDWHRGLTEVLTQNRARPAGRGWDGFLFVAEAVKGMTGRDIARGFRGYRSEAEALRKFQAKGFDGPVELLRATLRPVRRPRPGDVVVLEGGALGIWQGTSAYAVDENGWGLLPPDVRVVEAFAV